MSRVIFLLLLCLGVSSAVEGSGEDGDLSDNVLNTVDTPIVPCPEPTQYEPCSEPAELEPCAEPAQLEPCPETVKLEPCSESVQENPCPVLAVLEPRPETSIVEDGIRRWNHEDLVREYQKKEIIDEKPIWMSEHETIIDLCPRGWTSFKESCYLIEKNMTTMDNAERLCRQLDTTLFVANSIEEWNYIRSIAHANQFTWIGIFKEDETVADNSLWQTTGGLEPKYLNWLLGKNNDGWNAKSRCAAMFNNADTNYVHFYPCSYSYNFICERNATLYN